MQNKHKELNKLINSENINELLDSEFEWFSDGRTRDVYTHKKYPNYIFKLDKDYNASSNKSEYNLYKKNQCYRKFLAKIVAISKDKRILVQEKLKTKGKVTINIIKHLYEVLPDRLQWDTDFFYYIEDDDYNYIQGRKRKTKIDVEELHNIGLDKNNKIKIYDYASAKATFNSQIYGY